MSEQYAALRGNVNLLGQLLGQTIKDAQGQEILDKVEEIRALSKSDRKSTRLNSITRPDLVCRLLLEKKKQTAKSYVTHVHRSTNK